MHREEGAYGTFRKHLRDLAGMPPGHAGAAASLASLLPQLPSLARHSWSGAGPAPDALFHLRGPLPPWDPGALALAARHDPLTAALRDAPARLAATALKDAYRVPLAALVRQLAGRADRSRRGVPAVARAPARPAGEPARLRARRTVHAARGGRGMPRGVAGRRRTRRLPAAVGRARQDRRTPRSARARGGRRQRGGGDDRGPDPLCAGPHARPVRRTTGRRRHRMTTALQQESDPAAYNPGPRPTFAPGPGAPLPGLHQALSTTRATPWSGGARSTGVPDSRPSKACWAGSSAATRRSAVQGTGTGSRPRGCCSSTPPPRPSVPNPSSSTWRAGRAGAPMSGVRPTGGEPPATPGRCWWSP
ncbi:hypothetical protein ACRAWF_23310 [Streptomyces sp. L7]